MCDQEGSWDGQSNPSSYYSTSEVLFQDEATYSQSKKIFLQQQFPLSSNASVGDYIKNSDYGNFQSYSLSTCLFFEVASKEESDFELMVEEKPLGVDHIQNFPENLHEHTKPYLLAKEEEDKQSCSHSQHVEKIAVCDEEMKHKERDEDYQWDASLNLSNSEIFC